MYKTLVWALVFVVMCYGESAVFVGTNQKTSIHDALSTKQISNQMILSDKIGQMLMLGFFGTSAKKGSKICNQIKRFNLGGVILFDRNPSNKKRPKNIVNKKQLLHLTQELQSCSRNHDLFIAIDQEGGKVQRLKRKNQFRGDFPKPSSIVALNDKKVNQIYYNMGLELKQAGINFNLAPVVDLAINPNNIVINKLGRSFGKDSKTVVKYATIFLNQMHKHNIYTSLKHFPGHGSSLKDSHKGFVDVTNYWTKKELDPYKTLMQRGNIDTIMTAHIYNAHKDTLYPASLSFETVTELLRNEMGYNGVIITDDLQMGAISQKYNLNEILFLSIDAGNDILLFGNQLNPINIVSPKKIINTILDLIQDQAIEKNNIEKSYARIQKLKQKFF